MTFAVYLIWHSDPLRPCASFLFRRYSRPKLETVNYNPALSLPVPCGSSIACG
jgi:hypothetical protein